MDNFFVQLSWVMAIVFKFRPHSQIDKSWANIGWKFFLTFFNNFRARRLRKALGGGIRQGGILAAAAMYALDNVLPRLHLDHEHAKELSKGTNYSRKCIYIVNTVW